MSRLAIITFITPNGGDVDNSLPGGPVYPGQGLPIPPVYPGQGLPPFPGRPDNSLPGFGGRPDNSLPGMPPQAIQLPVFPFDPTLPDNELPDKPVVWPPRPGMRMLVKFIACIGLVMVPDNTLPETPEVEPK